MESNNAEGSFEVVKGASLKDIHSGRDMFESQNQAPSLDPYDSHTILFELPEDTNKLLIPRIGLDQWNSDFVKLPSSPSSKYLEIDEAGNKCEKSRWDLIRNTLEDKPINNSRDLEIAIKKYNNPKNANDWSFSLLHELFEDVFEGEGSYFFFQKVLPEIIKLAFRLPELIKSSIPFLKKLQNHSISMSQEQAGCLLANAFLCTFPHRNVARKNTDYPEINFNRLFSSSGDHVMEKLKCLCNYFKRICVDDMPNGVLTFQRRYIQDIELSTLVDWKDSDLTFNSIKLQVSAVGTIEDGAGMLQVDFANRYLGGGVLGWGCVQEEIRFVINPELIVGMLFCEAMGSTEAILITGCEQFSKYSGYSKSFKWTGTFKDETPRDQFRRKMTYVVAIDALSLHKPHLQYEEFALKRELNKACVGFYHGWSDKTPPIPVATGNWGCGAFRGHKPLKALLQLMACCANGRNIMYYTFGEQELADDLYKMFEFLQANNVKIAQIWKLVKQFKESKLSNQPEKLFPFIYERFEIMSIQKALQDDSEELSEVIVEEDDKMNKKRKNDEEIEVSDEKETDSNEEDGVQKKLKIDINERDSLTVEKVILTDSDELGESSKQSSLETPKTITNKITNYFTHKL